MLTLRAVDKLKLEEIADQISQGVERLAKNEDINVNKRNLLAKVLPTL